MNKIIAIGDIHGHFDQLMELWEKLEAEGVDFDKDEFVFLGDYVDGGPDVKKVLDFLIELKATKKNYHFLYGNHEDLLLDALRPHHPIYGSFDLWYQQGGRETVDSFVRDMDLEPYERSLISPKNVITEEYVRFLATLESFYDTEKYFFVHGGIYPNKSIEENKETTSRYDMIWIRDEFILSKYDWGKKIIFGHTINDGRYNPGFLSPIVRKNKIGIDTMMHNTGRLTAVILPDETFVQTDYVEDLEKI
jgi:serine/threonine protein phosphatase 1